MVDPKHVSNVTTASAPGAARTNTPSNTTDGVAFRALLERLERDARALEQDSGRIQDQKDLAGAVDRAHASLQDALTLGDRLIEAYREALAQKGATPADPGRAH
ncbi:MAG: hypothetical protein IPJ77_23465 [Planctomycetes bacterium]|nr:hypothetical protein [Planctomycetota bacterium]